MQHILLLKESAIVLIFLQTAYDQEDISMMQPPKKQRVGGKQQDSWGVDLPLLLTMKL